MSIISNFFEIFNFRFWLFLFEILYFPVGLAIGSLIYHIRTKGSSDEV